MSNRSSSYNLKLVALCEPLIKDFLNKFNPEKTDSGKFGDMFKFVYKKAKDNMKSLKEINATLDDFIKFMFSSYASQYTLDIKFRSDMQSLSGAYAMYLIQLV